MSYLIWILAIMWAVGLFAMMAYMIHDLCDTWPGLLFSYCLGIPMWVAMGLGPMALIKHEEGPVEATLLKSEWKCSAGHESTTTTFVLSGKVMVPVTSTTFVCDQYNRI